PPALEVGVPEPRAHPGDPEDDHPDDDPEPIRRDRPGKDRGAALPVPQPDGRDGRCGDAGQGEHQQGRGRGLPRGDPGEQQDHADADQDQLGQDRAELDGRGGHQGPPPAPPARTPAAVAETSASSGGGSFARRPPGSPRSSTSTLRTQATTPAEDGLILSRTRFGATPSTSITATTGTTAASSRGSRRASHVCGAA